MSNENPYAPDKSREEEILEDLRRVGEEHGKRLTADEYNEYGKYSDTYIKNHFDSFPEAIRQAGLFPAQNTRREDVVRAVKAFRAEFGHPPTRDEMNKQGVYSYTTIVSRAGSWREALQEAGYTEAEIENRLKKVDTQDLIDELQRVAAKVGHTPTQSDIDDHCEYHHATYYRRFGDLETARKEAGLPEKKEIDHPNRISTEDLLEELQELAEDLGHPPTTAEIDELASYSTSTYYDRFENFESAYRKAGLSPPHKGLPTSEDPSHMDLLTELLRMKQDLDRPITLEDIKKISRYSVDQYEHEFDSVRTALEDAAAAE